jgi:hypothetical protein
MNQKQREFLTKHITSVHDQKVRELKNKMRQEPSLNNHLVASFLDGSAAFNDIKKLREKIHQRVLKMSSGEVLIKKERMSRGIMGGRTEENTIQLRAEDLFIIPETYTKELDEVNAHNAKIEDEIQLLKDMLNTIIMKIQIGSDKHLAPLIEDVENIGDLRLVNSQLLLKA